ncbi:MAG: FecR family protein, partial [Polyangiales bacterium]
MGVLVVSACTKKDDAAAVDKTAQDPPKRDRPAESAKPARADVAAAIGVTAGGIAHDPKEGPAAVLTSATGKVEIRRVGELELVAAKPEDKLFPGDQVRTGDAATARVAIADGSVVEIAEVTTIGIASRDGTADPASAVAVLGGLARFTVVTRAPAEGPFRVYTPGGVIVTRGTVYGVGVAASGEARVGVESGVVDMIGLASFAATPVSVEAGQAATFTADGTVGASSRWSEDDWGTWRDDVDAELAIDATLDAHAKALADLDHQLVDTYADLDASATAVASFEASAATSADSNDSAAYRAALPDGAAGIDASFAVGGRLEALTWAYASHATLATDVYVRHPAEAEVRWQVLAPRVDAAVLWPKRFEVTAVGYLEPLRVQYYVHHPRGRVHAQLVGITVPAFYAAVEPPAIEPPQIRARVKTAIWIAPTMTVVASTRPVWVTTPSADWRASVKVDPAPLRANVEWYVRPPRLKAKLLVGANATGAWKSDLRAQPPQVRGSLAAQWKVPIGLKVRIAAPDVKLATKVQAGVRTDVKGRIE